MKRRASSLNEIDQLAATWIARRDRGLSEQEQVELDRWRAESTLHREALARFECAWSRLARPQSTGAGAQISAELQRLARRRRRVASAVTAVMMLLAIGISWRTFLPAAKPAPPATRTIVIAPTRQVLPDGSVVDHRDGTEVHFDFSGPTRRVTLKRGEAHFAVAKDATRPFVVEVAGVEVRAVGTAFSVALDSSQVEVLVTEGRVAVDQVVTGVASAAGDRGPSDRLAFVEAGSRFTIERARSTIAAPAAVSAEELESKLAWRRTRVEFSAAPLSEVVEVLNRHNHVQIALADPSLGSVMLSGLFLADDLATFTSVLETGFGIRAQHAGDRITLHR